MDVFGYEITNDLKAHPIFAQTAARSEPTALLKPPF
jgi:hypothetical protein